MLPQPHRLRRSAEFGEVVRRGRRAGGPSLVVHWLLRGDGGPVRVGFVVSRAVGNAVVRNRVKRRLRHILGTRLQTLPAGTSVVVRATPLAAGFVSSALARDLDTCLRRVRTAGQALPAGRGR